MKTISLFPATTPTLRENYQFIMAYEPSLDNGKIDWGAAKFPYVKKEVMEFLLTDNPYRSFSDPEELFCTTVGHLITVYRAEQEIEVCSNTDIAEMSFYAMKAHLIAYFRNNGNTSEMLLDKINAWGAKTVDPIPASKSVVLEKIEDFIYYYKNNLFTPTFRYRLGEHYPFDTAIENILDQ